MTARVSWLGAFLTRHASLCLDNAVDRARLERALVEELPRTALVAAAKTAASEVLAQHGIQDGRHILATKIAERAAAHLAAALETP